MPEETVVVNTARVLTVFLLTEALGITLALVSILGKQRRRYLMYLGIAFMVLGLGLLMQQPVLRLVLMAVATVVFVIALIVGVKDTKRRLHDFQVEQQSREQAFAEYLDHLAHQPEDAPDDTPPKAPGSA